MPEKFILPMGALLAAAAVALGAYSAHGLEKHLLQSGHDANFDQRVAWFESGVRYHMFHALALVIVAVGIGSGEYASGFRFAAGAFVVGILLFSGSLYAMTIGPDAWRKLGAVVPLGGVAFIVGWLAIAYTAIKR